MNRVVGSGEGEDLSQSPDIKEKNGLLVEKTKAAPTKCPQNKRKDGMERSSLASGRILLKSRSPPGIDKDDDNCILVGRSDECINI